MRDGGSPRLVRRIRMHQRKATWMSVYTNRIVRILVARSSVGTHHVPLDLHGANLEMATLAHVDLSGANLQGANLRGAMLWGARLDFANLDGADLTCADLTWASIAGCSTKGALFIEAEMDETTVSMGGLHDADTSGAGMVTLTFTAEGSRFPTVEQWATEMSTSAPKQDQSRLKSHVENAPRSLRLRGAAGWSLRSDPKSEGDWYAYKAAVHRQAQERVLLNRDIRDLLEWSTTTGKPLNLRGCNLSDLDLRNAKLDGACLEHANVTGADLRGATFVGADLKYSYGWPE